MLSYGWSDVSRFVTLGRIGAGAGAGVGAGSVYEGEEEEDSNFGDGEEYDDDLEMPDMMPDFPSDAPTAAQSSSPVTAKSTTKKAEDITDAEWQVVALGWRDFQADLRAAARMGVRVWRTKVCVVATSA